MTRLEKFKRSIVALCAVAAMIAVMVTPVQAAYHVELGPCVDEIESGKEYVIESVKFPGKVATPDKREQYKDYITLENFNASDPWGNQQVWHFTNTDSKYVDDEMLGHYDMQFTRPGMYMISNHTSYRGESWTKTLRLITYDAKKGYTAKFIEYNDDGSVADTQWFKCVKLRKTDDGKQIWKITGVSSGTRLAPGGWSEVVLHEPIEKD